MTNQLLADTEEAASSLQKRVKEFKITNVEGKDICMVVSLLRGTINCLTYIKKIPEDITKTMLKVMQTSSVDSFNETFHLIEKQQKHFSVLCKTGRNDADITVDEIFILAEAEFRDLNLDCKWTQVHTTRTESAFNATGGQQRAWTPTCFNCSGPHSNKDCPKPKDANQIKANLAKFRNKKKKRFKDQGGGDNKEVKTDTKLPGTGIWCKPKPNEHNRRVIIGRPHLYNVERKRWYPEKTPSTPAALPAVHIIPPTPVPPSPSASLNSATSSGKNQMVQLAVANSARAVNAAFKNLALQFMEE
jgi:hypothetical protein